MIPPADWRPRLPHGAFILGPASCGGCGAPVWYGRSMTRVLGEAVLGEVRVWRDWGAFRSHECTPKPISKHGLYTRERRARIKHRLVAQSRAEFEHRKGAA